MTLIKEEIIKKFNEKQYLIRKIFESSGGRKQYRFIFICENCGSFNLKNSKDFDLSMHKCSGKQKNLLKFRKVIPNAVVAQCKLICKTNISVQAGTSTQFYEYSKYLYESGQKSILQQLNEKDIKKIRAPPYNETHQTKTRTQITKDH